MNAEYLIIEDPNMPPGEHTLIDRTIRVRSRDEVLRLMQAINLDIERLEVAREPSH